MLFSLLLKLEIFAFGVEFEEKAEVEGATKVEPKAEIEESKVGKADFGVEVEVKAEVEGEVEEVNADVEEGPKVVGKADFGVEE